MAPVIIERDRHLVSPLPSEEVAMAAAQSSLERITIVRLMLSGAVGVNLHLAFRPLVPPPPGWKFAVAGIAGDSVPPAGGAVATELVGWLHRRLILAAQRTRLHSDEEIQALLGWAEAELILCALGCFHLDQYLEIVVPAYDETALRPTLITLAARGHASIEWTPDGPVSRALTPPPGVVIGNLTGGKMWKMPGRYRADDPASNIDICRRLASVDSRGERMAHLSRIQGCFEVDEILEIGAFKRQDVRRSVVHLPGWSQEPIICNGRRNILVTA